MKNKKVTWGVIIVVLVVVLIGILVSCFIIAPKIREKKEIERLVREYYANKLSIYEQENARYSDYEVDIAFLGDSLTDGYDLAKYYPNYVTANRGIGGETTFGLEERLKTSVYDLKPKVAFLLIGGNNLNTMFDNYEDILIGLKDNLPNTKVVLLSLTAMGKDWDHKNEIVCFNNVKIKLLAEKYGFEYVDLFTPLFDMNINELYADYSMDGVHFTDKGYRVVTSTIMPIINDILEK